MGAPMDEGCSCSEARAHLEAFLDHECDGDLRSRLEAHVASCEHCSRIADAVHGIGDHGRGHDDGAQQRDPLHPGLRRGPRGA